MSDQSEPLFKLYVLLQNLMAQHMIIDGTVKESSVFENHLDLETLVSAASAIITICQEIENNLNPNQKKCCCV